jgi:hypothetical protein
MQNELPKEQPRSGFNLTSQGYLIRIFISIGPKFGELLVRPMPSIMATPDSSVDEPACNGSTREEDGPQVPCLRPGWLRVQLHHGLIVAVSDHWFPLKEQSRRAEYNRPTASPSWVRMGRQYPVPTTLTAFVLRRNETRSLSLISAPRVNSGTAKKKDAKAVSCSVDGQEDATLKESAARRACEVTQGAHRLHGQVGRAPGFATTSNIQMRAETGQC